MAAQQGEPEYPVILHFTQDGDEQAPAAWSLTQGYEVLSEGSSISGASAQASAVASTLPMGNRTRIYTNNDKIRERLLYAGVDNVSATHEYFVIQPGIRKFASENNIRMLTRYRLEEAGKPVPVTPQTKPSTKGLSKYQRLPRLTIATDASMALNKSYVAGVAWVAEDGRHSTKVVDVGDGGIAVAELWAIYNVFESIHRGQKLLIQTDSQPAIHAYEARESILANRHKHSSKKVEVIEAISAALADRDVILQWVKGHDGHFMNETADKLAKFSRRCYEVGDDSPERWSEVDKILLEGIGFDRETKTFVQEQAS